MNEEIINKLNKLGLNNTEANIYVFGLGQKKSIGVSDIHKHTDYKRPTIYHALDTLSEKGLVAKVQAPGRKLYSFTSPEQIQRIAESKVLDSQRRLKLAVELSTQLASLQVKKSGTKVSHFEGSEGVKTVVDMALYCKDRSWDILAPKKNFFSEYDANYQKYFLNTRKRFNIISRTLWEENKSNQYSMSPSEIKRRNPRYLPKTMTGNFESTMIIFDDKVAIISSINDLSAILIESEEISNFFRSIFTGLWEISEPYLSRKKLAQS